MKKINTKTIVYLALLIAMQIVLTRFLSITTPIIRIGFTFIPLALGSVMFGPVLGGVAAAISDLIGVMLFPSGPFFAGFTLSAFAYGVIYGVLLYKKEVLLKRVIIAVALNAVFVDLIMNTCWLSILTGKAALVILPARAIKSAIMFPIQTAMIYSLWRVLFKRLDVKNLF